MVEILTPDICVIGGGSGGLSVAAAAASFGVPVVLVEKGKMGGDCLNTGCVPSKALLAAAKHVRSMQTGGFGVNPQRPEPDFSKVHDHVRAVIAAIAPNDSRQRFAALGVRVLEGSARFIDEETVAVDGGARIKARRFVVATGSKPAVPPIPGLADVAYLTNETIFDLTRLPGELIVIGAGPVGLELAQAFRRLGSKVTVIEAQQALAKDDRECAAIVTEQLEREGIEIWCGAKITKIETESARIRLTIERRGVEEVASGTHLLVAAGRKPGTELLDLEKAGIKYGPAGVVVDKRLRTTNKRVYAVGDVTGRAQFTHAVNYHAGLVIRHALFRIPVNVAGKAIPWVTYTDPELAQVGLTEDEARQQELKIRILRWPFHENDRAQAELVPLGHIKVVTDKQGRILGATIVGRNAGELITTWSLALDQGMNIRKLAELVVPYPTLAEVGKRAAMTYFTPSLTNPWVQRAIRWLRRFG